MSPGGQLDPELIEARDDGAFLNIGTPRSGPACGQTDYAGVQSAKTADGSRSEGDFDLNRGGHAAARATNDGSLMPDERSASHMKSAAPVGNDNHKGHDNSSNNASYSRIGTKDCGTELKLIVSWHKKLFPLTSIDHFPSLQHLI